MKIFLKKLIAYLHLSQEVVCEMSKGMGDCDYHDYKESIYGTPDHFCILTCRYCGKKYTC